MDSHLQAVIQNKIQEALEPAALAFTRRAAALPSIKGKAMCIVGIRRAGKTTFLHQCRADELARGTAAEQMVYSSLCPPG